MILALTSLSPRSILLPSLSVRAGFFSPFSSVFAVVREAEAELVGLVLGEVAEGGGVVDLVDERGHRRGRGLEQLLVRLHLLERDLQVGVEDPLQQVPDELRKVDLLDELAGQVAGLVDALCSSGACRR